MSLGGGFSQAVDDAVTNAVDAGTPFAVPRAKRTPTPAAVRQPARLRP
jgi:hypothetical protein